jgi:hypothetical protein
MIPGGFIGEVDGSAIISGWATQEKTANRKMLSQLKKCRKFIEKRKIIGVSIFLGVEREEAKLKAYLWDDLLALVESSIKLSEKPKK